MNINEYDYDDDGAAEWKLTMPAPSECEYIITVGNADGGDQRRVFIRDPNADTDLPFVQVHPEFYRDADWPPAPETYSLDLVTGTVTVDDDI